MKLCFLLALWLWLVFGSIAVAQEEATESYVRFFNDSAKAVYFYIDDQFSCSIPASPEGNLAFCDAEISNGKHTVSMKGPRVARQSCDLFVQERTHAEANVSKGERFRCYTVRGLEDLRRGVRDHR